MQAVSFCLHLEYTGDSAIIQIMKMRGIYNYNYRSSHFVLSSLMAQCFLDLFNRYIVWPRLPVGEPEFVDRRFEGCA